MNITTTSHRHSNCTHSGVIVPAIAIQILALTSACGPNPGSSDQDAGLLDAGTDTRILPDARRPDVLEPDALVAVCGNGILEGGEVCDDGNDLSGDGCNATCTAQDGWDHLGPSSLEGDQNEPVLACSEDGLALVWTDWNARDGEGASVQMRLFGADGLAKADQIQVNVAWTGHQHQADAAWLPNGGIAVVWTNGTSMGNIELRIFDSSGQRLTDDVPVASEQEGDQQMPALSVNQDGTILVVWADDSSISDQDGYGISARLFDSDGNALTNATTGDSSSFTVDTIPDGVQRDPDVCLSGNGGFLVVWTDGSGQLDQNGFGIAGALVAEDGSVGDEFLVNDTTTGQQMAPAAALQVGLGPVVVWADHSLTEDMEEFGIRARLLTAEGGFRQNAQGTDSDFLINSTTAGSQEMPDVASLPDGAILVVWQDWSGLDGSGSGIRARALASDGSPASFLYSDSGDDFQVNSTFVQSQQQPTVCGAAGSFFTAWTDESGHAPDNDTAIRMRAIVGW